MSGLIGDRVFHIYDVNRNGFIDLMEFVTVSGKFLQSGFDAKMKLVFDIFDINRDGFISGDDIKGILSHIPLELIVFLFPGVY